MSTRKITPFLFEGQITIRVIDRGGEAWFVAADLCRALGLSNPAETVSGLDDDEKGISSADTLGGVQGLVIVSESGMYALIFKSRKPNAVAFRKWVTSEVLPTLRRTGTYLVAPNNPFGFSVAAMPFLEWSLQDKRVAISAVNTARHVFNTATAAWLWSEIGLPIPPRHLLPGWWQGELLNQPINQPPQ